MSQQSFSNLQYQMQCEHTALSWRYLDLINSLIEKKNIVHEHAMRLRHHAQLLYGSGEYLSHRFYQADSEAVQTINYYQDLNAEISALLVEMETNEANYAAAHAHIDAKRLEEERREYERRMHQQQYRSAADIISTSTYARPHRLTRHSPLTPQPLVVPPAHGLGSANHDMKLTTKKEFHYLQRYNPQAETHWSHPRCFVHRLFRGSQGISPSASVRFAAARVLRKRSKQSRDTGEKTKLISLANEIQKIADRIARDDAR